MQHALTRRSPVLGDTGGADPFCNYTAVCANAGDRNEASQGCSCGAMGPAGAFRLRAADADPAKTAAAVALWEEAIEKFHRPDDGINIAIGPVTCYAASPELIAAGATLRKKHGLAGHIHLLETQGQKLQSRQYFGKKGAVGMLKETGFLARGWMLRPPMRTHFLIFFPIPPYYLHRICQAHHWPTPCG